MRYNNKVNDVCEIYFYVLFSCGTFLFSFLLLWLLRLRILSLLLNLLIDREADPTNYILPIFLDERVTTVDEMEVRKLLLLHHVNSTIKHDGSSPNFNDDAGSSHILSSP